MDALYLGDARQNDLLHLHGADVVPPVRGAVRQAAPGQLPDGCVEEVITIECKAGDIRSLITTLEQRLMLLNNGLQPLYLWLRAAPGSAPLGAPLLRGSLELLGGGTLDRMHGYQGLCLRLVRPAWLAEMPGPVPLQNAHGVDVLDGLTVFNHSDGGAGHVNFCGIPGSHIGGAQPQPARLVIDLGGPAVRKLGKIVVSGGIDLWDDSGSFEAVLEGEAALPGAGCTANAVINNIGASGGAYQDLQWAATADSPLFRWTLDSDRLAWLNGRGVRPVARFHTPPPADTRLRWKLLSADGNTQIDQSPAGLLDAASRLQVLPAFFPPLAGSSAPFESFILEAWLECAVAGTKQVAVDFIHLFPLDNFAFFEPLSGIQQNHSLVADWPAGAVYAEAESGEKSLTHAVSGAPLVLVPQRNHRIYVLYESDAGMVISDTVKLRVLAGARWQLP